MDRIPELPIHDEYLAYQITAINHGIEHVKAAGGDTNQISDGYHTFGELYEHRIALWIALCKAHFRLYMEYGCGSYPWRAKMHSDGTELDGWFLLGLKDEEEEKEQITYHLPISKWEECNGFTETLDRAPEFDGHTSADVLQRLKGLSIL